MTADEVSKLASSDEGGINKDLEMEVQKRPSIEEIPMFAVEKASSWMTPIMAFIQDGYLPQDSTEAKKVRKRAARFTILNDIVGPLPQGKGQVKFLLVVIDYFTKWVEAEALATITESRIQSFVWKNIICRFGIPLTIISNNKR